MALNLAFLNFFYIDYTTTAALHFKLKSALFFSIEAEFPDLHAYVQGQHPPIYPRRRWRRERDRPPTEESTAASSVVGTWTRGTPRM